MDWWCVRAPPAEVTTPWLLVISKLTPLKISQAYLFTDITVLALSLSYIPVRRIVYSLVTVTISSYLIDIVTTFGKDKDEKPNSEAVPE